MTAPPFVFNRKTGELQRGGRVIALCRLHADIFNCLAHAQTSIGCPAIARAVNMPVHAVENEMPRLARRLSHVWINICSSNQRHGKWLEFEDIPKWRPSIPPPVRLDGEAR